MDTKKQQRQPEKNPMQNPSQKPNQSFPKKEPYNPNQSTPGQKKPGSNW